MMVTRNYRCPHCEKQREATALGMKEPDTPTCECGKLMLRAPNTVAGFKFRGEGFHCVDYPKSAAQLKKDYGLDKHDSTDPNSDYNQEGYAEEMVSKVPRVSKPKG
jgi:predicted nucleic acid-binding Zn ribbon protein